MNYKLLIVLSIAFCSCTGSFKNNSQVNNISIASGIVEQYPDSAIKIANSILQDTISAKLSEKAIIDLYLLKEKAFSKKRQVDSVLAYSKMVREKATLSNDSIAITESLIYIIGDVDRSVKKELEELLPAHISFAERKNLYYPFAKLSALYGIILASRGEIELSQKILIRAIKAMDSLDKKAEQISISIAIASNFSEVNSNKEALAYYKKAQSLAEEIKDSAQLASVLNNIGIFHYQDSLRDSANWYYDKALTVLPASLGPFQRIKILYNRYISALDNGYVDDAMYGFQKMLQECRQLDFTEGEAVAHKALGIVFKMQKSNDSAIVHLTHSIRIADELNDQLLKLKGLIELEEVYANQGNLAAAYKVRKQHQPIQDSLLSNEKQIELHDLEANFQLDKREVENKLLKTQLLAKQNQLLLLMVLLITAGFLVYFLRKRNQYQVERNRSYEVLIGKYKQEKLLNAKKSTEKVTVSPVITDPIAELFSAISRLYQTEKPFLDPGLKIDEITEKLNASSANIIQALKVNGFKTFSSFTNYYRVMEVRRMFEDPNFDHMKLDAIGSISGFRAKQTFYIAFELQTGMKPGFYRSRIKG